MKKIKIAIIGLLVMGLGTGLVNAQDKATAPAAKSTPAAKTEKKAAPASGQHLKKDGTPDKRYKENKTDAKPATSKSTKGTAAKKGSTTTKVNAPAK